MAAKKKRVLIVEDAQDVARLISSALESVHPNLKIMTCPSAEEAMLESAREGVQLLITDIRLPGISGTELIRKIGARNPAMKVILITGLSGTQIGRQMDGIQVEGFFRKPFDVNELLEVAERCLNGEAQSESQPAQPEASSPAPKQAAQPDAQPTKQEKAPQELIQALDELRREANASAVLLVGPDGALTAATGPFPGGAFKPEWAPLVAQALDGQKPLAARMGLEAPQSALILAGKDCDLVIVSVGAHSLALALKPQAGPLRSALALEEVARARPQLEKALKDLPAPAKAETREESRPAVEVKAAAQEPSKAVKQAAQTAVPAGPKAEQPSEPEAALGDLAALFDGGGLKPVDVDAFWDLLAEASAIEPMGKDSISFEKARKLGLVNDLGD